VRVLFATPGHDVHDARFLEAIRSLGHEPIKAIVSSSYDLLAAVATARVDVIHAGPIGTVAHWAGEAGIRPLVVASWGYDLLTDPWPERERLAAADTIAAADALIVDCRAAADVARSLGMPAERTITLPWGVDLARYHRADPADRRAARATLGWEAETIVVTVREHEPIYGVDVAIDGFLRAAERRPELRLVVAGDGSRRTSLQERVDRSGISGRVRFVGRLRSDEVASILAAADIYLSASHVDGTSVSLLEAMATGLSVVVSDIPGNREWVEPGANGERFVDGDADSLADALVRLSSAPDVRSRMGLAGRSVVERHADWSRNMGRIGDAYELALQHASD
jgi:glycosyltransferase involved in cell wall biosynthesis